MKKKMMVLAALLMAVAVTGYSVSGTYAKYISSIDKTDEARVAKWGVNAEPIADDLFKNSYLIDENDEGSFYVKSNGTDNVVAPGTEGEYTFEITFDGAPEVNYTLDIDTTGSVDNINDNNYAPIKYYFDGEEMTDFDDLIDHLEGLFASEKYAGYQKVYAAGTLPTETLKHTIRWEWAFDETESAHIYNDEDTTLGNKAVGEDVTVKLSVKVTAQQVKEAADPVA